MQIKINANTFFVFDLDDTLYHEIDFLKSGYRYIASLLSPENPEGLYAQMLDLYRQKQNVFDWLVDKYQEHRPGTTKTWLLQQYREHIPSIQLHPAAKNFLQNLRLHNVPLGLITDGRSITQRNKIAALGLSKYFTDVVISEEFGSEKPDERNFIHFQNQHPGSNFYFFADNTNKDFIVPLKLGWRTFCVKNAGNHIHPQAFDSDHAPEYIISSFDEVEIIWNEPLHRTA